ncbi:TNF receptor-associated factor 5-like [Halichondria panicea]|uniref:TNF receptor-associated factor 5-like n=1 Tax=Halichondria panicea TaxID=6063 RepID=UPI00312B3EA5
MASPVNYDFVDEVPEDHHCTICTSILTDPVLTECCGQLFCKGCVKNWLLEKKTCPHCRGANFVFIKNLRMKRAVDSLKVYCPNRSKGCDKVTTLSACNQHLEKCLFVEASCTNECEEKILRKELQDHEDNKCPNRRVRCQYCNIKGMHKEITTKTHLDKCPLFPISCFNNCGHEKVQRWRLAGHQKVCPLEPVKCPLFEAGCREMIPRKDLAAHKASNTEHHLELVMTETVTLKQEVNKLKQKAKTFEQEAEAEREATKLEAKSTKDQLQQISLKFDGLAFCIDSNPQTQAAIKNIKSSLETMTTMLAPGDTRYYLLLVKESEYRARSASFYIKPGYKMYVSIDNADNCVAYLEKGEHDNILKWPMPEMEIKLRTRENQILYRVTICTKCGLTVNRLEGDRTQQDIEPRPSSYTRLGGVLRNFVFLTVREHYYCPYDDV